MTSELCKEIEKQLVPLPTDKIAVAVSGGSDSLALLYLLHEVARHNVVDLYAVTVDHGLRSEAREEARQVEAICVDLAVPHDTLLWREWDGKGNTQNAARNARYTLIADWARAKGIETVVLGHTQDDQAETFIMRLARASGVDGLSAMPMRRQHAGVTWLRPLLNVRRAALQSYLRDKGVQWVDDPSNEDPRFERVRVRDQMDAFAKLGLTAEVHAQVAQNLAQARNALTHQARIAALDLVSEHAGALRIHWQGLQALPAEIRRRLLIASFNWLGGSFYPPRRAALEAVWDALNDKGTATLQGCILRRKQENLWLCRELNAVRHLQVTTGELWDGRWRVSGPEGDDGFIVSALGEEGLLLCPDWREAGLPREVFLSTPAVWKGPDLVASPLVKPDQAWQAVLARGEAEYFDAVISH